MKRLSFLLISLCISLSALCQPIEIGAESFPIPGYSATLSIADTTASLEPGSSGQGQVWDFSQLSPVRQDEVAFLGLNELPFSVGFSFGDATVARQVTADDTLLGFTLNDAYEFFKLTETTYENIGFTFLLNEIPIPLVVERDPDDVLYNFPMKFGDGDVSISRAVLEVTIISLYYQQDILRANFVDGEGTVLTPFGSFPSLRVVSTVDRVDSVRLDTQEVNIPLPIQREYKWISPGERLPVMEINAITLRDSVDAPEITSIVRYMDTLRLTTSLVNPLEEGGPNIYPNPASDQVWIDNQQLLGREMEIEVLTADGKKILATSSLSNLIALDLTAFPAGTYLVRVSMNGEVFNGKLSVSK